MTDVEYDDDVLRIGDTTHQLRHPVGDVLEYGDKVIVRISPPSGEYDENNVLCFDVNGDKLWETEAPDKRRQHTFSTIRVSNGDVVGKSWNNHRYKIDVETGDLADLGFTGK